MADKKMVEAITSMEEDFAQWYTDVVKKSQEQKREFSLSEIRRRLGTLKISAPRCGNFTTLKSTRAKA